MLCGKVIQENRPGTVSRKRFGDKVPTAQCEGREGNEMDIDHTSRAARSNRRSFSTQGLASLLFPLLAFACSAIWVGEAHGSSTGITGRTLKSGATLGCGSCHSTSQTLSVAITGLPSLTVGTSSTYTLTVSDGAAGTNIGLDVAASDVGALSEASTNLKLLNDEITHTNATNPLTITNGSGTGSYSFTYTMPAGAAAGSTHTLYAAARVGGKWNNASNFSITAKQNQTITALFNGSSAPAATTFGASGALSISGALGSGAVTYSSSNTGVCSVSNVTDTLSAVGVGSCIITATKAGDSSYNADSDTFSLTVNKANQGAITARINGVSTDAVFTYLTTPTATLSNVQSAPLSTGAVTYSSSNTAVCTVTAGTTLNLVGAGTCIITVTRALDANYNAVSDTIGVTVNKAVQSPLTALINGSAANPSFSYQFPNGTATLSTSGGSGIGAVTYGSSNNVICSLSATTLTLASAGTCTITATKATDTNYLQATDVIAVTVNSTAPGAPTGIGGSAGDQQVTVTFAAPTNNGGAPPLSYTASCSAAGQITRSNTGATSPIVVGGGANAMTNAVTYACSVTATNANLQVSAPSGTVMLTPSATPVAPAFTSTNSATFPVLTAGNTFAVMASGFPAPTITLIGGTLPTGMSFAGGAGSGVLSGTPASGQAGNRALTFQAQNASGTVVQSFTLRVPKLNQALEFNPPKFQEFSPGDLPLAATATLAPVEFDTSTPTFCSVTGATFRTLTLGDCTLIAFQAGDIDYNPINSGKLGVTIIQGSQTITFPPQPGQTFSPAGTFVLTPPATASSELTVFYDTLTPSVCFVADKSIPEITIVSAGLCTVLAIQEGDTNYLGAKDVARDININPASQSISWGAQSNQPFGTGGTFAISPLATGGASGNAIVYDSITPSVCTLAGTTITKVSAGICTLTANQAGNANYTAAPQELRSINITASLPNAPTATQLTASDAQIVIEFDPPTNNGGSPITGYTAACGPSGPSGNIANAATSPITVTGLTNNTSYSCAVAAQNAAGTGPLSNVLMATPTLASGINLWTNGCSGCHGQFPTGVRFNAAGQTGNVLAYVRVAQPTMLAQAGLQALTLNELAEIAKYIASFVPAISVDTPFNTVANIDVASHLTIGTVTFEGAEVVDAPLHGTLSVFNNTQIVYTPTPGYAGPDAFTYRGLRNTPILKGDKRAVTINVAAPPAPVITSPAIAAGMFNTPFAYQITATNSPTSFAAAPLGVNFTVNTSNGLISGTPMVTGSFSVTVSATNAGGTGMQVVDVTIGKANQTITFGAQAGRAFVPNGTFPLSPVATVNSPLAVSYSPLTPAVCTISGTTVTMLTAGVCMIAADQSGNANYNAALQVSQPVNIAATAPDAPTIGAATPGDTVAAIGFTPPANNGGSTITGYNATCLPNGSGSSGASPITVSGLINDITYTCSVTATNAINTGPPSGTVTVTPTAIAVAPQIASANATTFTVGAPGAFSVTATGTPTPTLALTGTLPSGVTFTPSTGALAGTPALGTVNTYPLTITATSTTMPAAMQTFTLTVAKANQTISFTGPASQPFSTATINLTATSTSSLSVTLTSNTTPVCTLSGSTLTLVGVGTCSITASQAGDANYNAATSVTQGFTVGLATQTINFPVQATASRSFVAATTFPINPVATATSGLAVIYSSTTNSVCTVVGLNATMFAPGTCTIAANQSGSANFLAAVQVTQNVLLNATVPAAPVIGAATGGNAQATINFTAPTNNGGSAITGYTATCNPGNISAGGSASPIVVGGLANNIVHTCSVTATNALGTGPSSASVAVTPLSGQGAALWTQVCDVCHTAIPSGTQLNGAGISATVLNFVRANQTLMTFNLAVQSLTNADIIDIANYIASVVPPNNATTSIGIPVVIDVNNHISLTAQPWSAFTSVEVVTGPANGTLGPSFTGTQIQYTPNPGFTGTDSFTYRGKRTGAINYNGDPQTVTIAVNPLVPVITSASTASGTFGLAFGYQITASNTPTSFAASGLPGGLGVSPAGLISGIPTETGQFNVSISAINAGGIGGATLTLQIDPAPQTIAFGAQTTPRTFSVGGTFAISPLATGGASGNPITYGSNQPSVCTVTVSGSTATMFSAGICTITANQAGNANYAAAAQATQSVTISPTLPAAPTIGIATPGNTTATIAFTPAANNTGSTITGFNASCTPSGAGSNSVSPITVSGLTNGVTYTCSVTATNAAGTSAPSGTVNVTPAALPALALSAVLSRKTHGPAGDFDVVVATGIAIGDAVTTEPRAIGAGHTLLFQFNNPIGIAGSVAVVDSLGTAVGSASAVGVGNDVVVTLTGIPDNQRVTVTLSGVNGGFTPFAASIGFLVGDVNNTRAVNSSDISGVKARSGQALNASNFMFDVNANGSVTSSDISAVKARSGLTLAP